MDLTDVVDKALNSRNEYFDILPVLQHELKEKYDILIKNDLLTSNIKDFLQNRGINYKANLEKLVQDKPDEVVLLGEVYHFVRKTGLKNYQFRDPIPLIETTLTALEPVDNKYAAKFLEKLCTLMSEDSYSQPIIGVVLGKILPDIATEYKGVMQGIGMHKGDNHKYEKEKSKVDSAYNTLLDGLFEYIKGAVKKQYQFSIEDFNLFRRNKSLQNILIAYH